MVDNGHGENTPGKRSPDGRLREWSYTREIADMVIFGLRKKGVDAERIVKEDTDVPLSERCRRANDIYKETGKKAILVSDVYKRQGLPLGSIKAIYSLLILFTCVLSFNFIPFTLNGHPLYCIFTGEMTGKKQSKNT